ncbi:MAG: alpha/beta fold hydrolase [Pseudomonadota bacterium]
MPRWLTNGKVHTVVGGLPLRTTWVRRRAAALLAASVPLTLDAGAGVRLNAFRSAGEGGARVVLIHGWEGDAHSRYLLSTADALHRAGHEVVRLQLRDHGENHALNEGPFLGSEHGEVLRALADLQRQLPAQCTCVVGYSLGGNFAVRLAVHAPAAALDLRAVLAICPPVRPRDAARAISQSVVYNRYFSMRWKRSIRKKIAAFPSWRAHRWLLDIDDIIAMHDAFVPVFTDFANTDAYFESYALTAEHVPSVSCPTDLLLAADDPICPVSSLPVLARPPGLSTTLVPHGGHCAFLDSAWLTSWMDDHVCNWVAAHV